MIEIGTRRDPVVLDTFELQASDRSLQIYEYRAIINGLTRMILVRQSLSLTTIDGAVNAIAYGIIRPDATTVSISKLRSILSRELSEYWARIYQERERFAAAVGAKKKRKKGAKKGKV